MAEGERAKRDVAFARQLADWTRVAAGWRRWEPQIVAMTWPMTLRLLAGLELKPGDRVLDVGCGTGDTTLALACVVGAEHVVAIDPVAEMIDTGRARAAAMALSAVDFRVTPVEEATFSEGSFAGVCARWSLIFCEDVVGQLRRIRSWLAPGGRLAMAAWTPQPETPGFEAVNRALNRRLDLPPLDPNKPGRIHLSDPGQLRDAIHAAGFDGIRIERVPLSVVTRDGDEFWRMMCAMGGALSRVLEELDESHCASIRDEVIESVEAHRVGDVLRIPAPAQAAFARRVD